MKYVSKQMLLMVMLSISSTSYPCALDAGTKSTYSDTERESVISDVRDVTNYPNDLLNIIAEYAIVQNDYSYTNIH